MQSPFDMDKSKLAECLNLATKAGKIGIWDWDILQDYLVWDEQMYRLYGVEEADFTGAYNAWLTGIYPDDRKENDTLTQKALQEHAPYETEFRVLWPDGTIHWLHSDGQVICDPQGIAIRMVGTNYDVTEYKALLKILEENENKYSILFNKAGVPAVLVKLPEMYFVDANEAFEAIFGYPKQEMIGKTSLDLGLVNPEARSQTIREVEQFGSSIDKERMVFTKSGQMKFVTQNVNTVELNGSMYAITTLTDITDIKQKEYRIQQLNRLYATLTQINLAIVRQTDQANLFDEICKITIEFGKYSMACIGILDTVLLTLTPVSTCSLNSEATHVALTIKPDNPRTSHPAVQSITTKNCIIIENISEEPDSEWKQSLLKQGYLSLASIPVFKRG